MANDQINVPSLIVILVLSGLVVRYLFFSPPSAPAAGARGGQQQRAGAAGQRDPQAAARQREASVERIQQMFPQLDRRTILWDLQRHGGSIAATTERILAGRLETPPVTFQPPPPPGSSHGAPSSTTSNAAAARPAPEKPAQPDLITRYNLQDKVAAHPPAAAAEEGQPPRDAGAAGAGTGTGTGKKTAWSSSREERQALLQRRREEMILEARRKMEAKIAAEKAPGAGAVPGGAPVS